MSDVEDSNSGLSMTDFDFDDLWETNEPNKGSDSGWETDYEEEESDLDCTDADSENRPRGTQTADPNPTNLLKGKKKKPKVDREPNDSEEHEKQLLNEESDREYPPNSWEDWQFGSDLEFDSDPDSTELFRKKKKMPKVDWDSDFEAGRSSDEESEITEYGDNDIRIDEIQELEKRLRKMGPKHGDVPYYKARLGESLLKRYTDSEEGNISDLHAAVKMLQESVLNRTSKRDRRTRARYLQSLAGCFKERHRRLGDLSDLEAALRVSQEALDLTPEKDEYRSQRLQNLGMSLTYRYKILGDLNDLEASIQRKQEALNLTTQANPDRPDYLQSLSISFMCRHKRLGELGDLEAALQNDQEAVDLALRGNPRRAHYVLSLSISLRERYWRLGALSDLQDAIRNGQIALALPLKKGPSKVARLKSLAKSFRVRYQRLGDLKDLEAAFHGTQDALSLTKQGDHHNMADLLEDLAAAFMDRYRRLGDLQDLESVLQKMQKVIDLPIEHSRRADHLKALAEGYQARYERLEDLNDLEVALQRKQEAVDLHPKRADYLHSLATSFKTRYTKLKELSDLEAALQNGQNAVECMPDGDPNGPLYLQSLASSFADKYRKFGRPEDLNSMHNNYTASFKMPTSRPDYSWNAALAWAAVSEEFNSPQCIPAYSTAFHLLPEILWIGNVVAVRHEAIFRLHIGKVTAEAARTCIDFSDFTSAVELIEQGIGITFQQMLQLKTNTDQLPLEQANKLQFLSSELYSEASPNPKELATEWQDLLKEIHQIKGLESFLLPKAYEDLCLASQGGPVVILTSHNDHCDGIIIPNPKSDPVHVLLPHVTPDMLKSQHTRLSELLRHYNVRKRGETVSTRLFGQKEQFELKKPEESFSDLLAWLHTYIVSPVYQTLELHGICDGRLWWLPTGAFTGLPLHACSPTTQFIQSYTSTLGSLLDAYTKIPSAVPKVGIVGVEDTSYGSNYLPGVNQEVDKILSIIKKPHVLRGPQATVDAVKQQLQDCSWIHLACHGTQDLVEPTKSHLLLYDAPLHLETILRMPTSNAEFVFLAACQTAKGDTDLANESFHLGGGFIAAGFRGAIGTLWSMNDRDGPLVAESVYSHLFCEGRQPQASDAAKALQLAVAKLKAQKPEVSYERWVPFIHIGV
ncbi:CHAT domain-containing protein [Mycena pura]|uniref:CHAT domain-containing protein n=1 Tax=Mycena pura TaxID=153505 RepID=A0AAD6V0K1_9AGAR|nr:CHAT domain-containing protein [Mycena pura]